MLNQKRAVVFFMLLVLAVSLWGCQQTPDLESTQNEASAPKQEVASSEVQNTKDTLIYVNFRDIRDLNPHLYGGEMYAQEMLYETLISLGPNGYEPCLAERWEVSEDGLKYTFSIREGVFFTDGEALDAFAIKANFDAIMENAVRHSWLEFTQIVKSYEAVDQNTFVIEVEKPFDPLLTELAVTRPFAMISPKAMIDGQTKDGVNGYIGTGPYILKEHVQDQYAIFKRNDNYWGEKPPIKTIKVKVISDNQSRVLALRNGEVDLIYGKNMLDADTIKGFEKQEGFVVALSEPTSTRQILMNTSHPVLSDRLVRQALQHATDRETIAEGIFYGYEKPAHTLYSESLPYCNVGLIPYAYNLEKASQILDEAGWEIASSGIRVKGNEQLSLNLLYNVSSVTEKTIAEYLQSEFRKIGVELNIDGQEEQSYRDRMKAGNFDLVFNISWGTPYDPFASLSAMRQTVYGDYVAQQGLAVKDELHSDITALLLEPNHEKRQELYKKVLFTLHEEALYLPITFESNKAVFTKELEHVSFAMSQYEVPFAKMRFKTVD